MSSCLRLDQRRIDIDHDPPVPHLPGHLQPGKTGRASSQSGPHLAPLDSSGRGECGERGRVEIVEDPPHRRRRRGCCPSLKLPTKPSLKMLT
jgi:hypothetical protein